MLARFPEYTVVSVVLTFDNDSCHCKLHERTIQYLRLIIPHLGSYSPNLNSVEIHWSKMKCIEMRNMKIWGVNSSVMGEQRMAFSGIS